MAADRRGLHQSVHSDAACYSRLCTPWRISCCRLPRASLSLPLSNGCRATALRQRAQPAAAPPASKRLCHRPCPAVWAAEAAGGRGWMKQPPIPFVPACALHAFSMYHLALCFSCPPFIPLALPLARLTRALRSNLCTFCGCRPCVAAPVWPCAWSCKHVTWAGKLQCMPGNHALGVPGVTGGCQHLH